MLTGRQWSGAAATPTDVFLAKLDPLGGELWTTTYDGPFSGWDRPEALAVDVDGNILVGGEIEAGPATSDLWFAKYDPTGNQQWEVFVDGPNGLADVVFGIAGDAWANVLVTGVVWGLDGDADLWLGKYDTDGGEVWTEIIEGPNSFGADVVADDQGNAYFTATHGLTGTRNIWVGAYDPDGLELWTTEFDGVNVAWDLDTAGDIAMAPTGELVVVGGLSNGFAGSNLAWSGKLTPMGSAIWQPCWLLGPSVNDLGHLGPALLWRRGGV